MSWEASNKIHINFPGAESVPQKILNDLVCRLQLWMSHKLHLTDNKDEVLHHQNMKASSEGKLLHSESPHNVNTKAFWHSSLLFFFFLLNVVCHFCDISYERAALLPPLTHSRCVTLMWSLQSPNKRPWN